MNRCGHSLTEMMIVLAVLAGIAGLAIPMFKVPFDKICLKAAAQEVSGEMSKTRLKSMQSGVQQVFQINLETGQFQSSPMDRLEEPDESDEKEKELPSGVFFELKNIKENEEGWTDIAVFFPNGDNQAAKISLTDNSDLHVDVTLNSLTGTVKIGDVYREKDDDNHCNDK